MPLINIFTKETAPVLITALRKYTGASFKDINAILRNNWDNEINGEVDKEIEVEVINDKVYVSIKDIASVVDYKYYNGGYKQYSEEADKYQYVATILNNVTRVYSIFTILEIVI